MVNITQAPNNLHRHQDTGVHRERSAQTGPEVPPSIAILQPITWSTYQALVADLGDHSAARLAYDQGTLEIKMPSPLHEFLNRLLERIVITLTEELGMSLLPLGSTRFENAALEQGVEPDSCFYIQNADRVDLEDPNSILTLPPDLVIEIDITSSSKSRLKIYQTLGVPEIWLYSRQEISILRLEQGQYQSCQNSAIFTVLSRQMLQDWVEQGQRSKNHNPLIAQFRSTLQSLAPNDLLRQIPGKQAGNSGFHGPVDSV